MGIFIDTLYSEDTNLEIYFRESELMLKQFMHQNMKDDEIFYEAEEEENTAKKQGVLTSLIQRIKKFIQTMKEKIANFFNAVRNSTGGENLTPDAYLQSDTGVLHYSKDLEDIAEQIEEEILAEKKGVQALSKLVKKFSSKSGLPVDAFVNAKSISAMVDKVNAFVVKDGGKVLTAAAATAISSRLSKCIRETSGIAEETEKLTNEFEKINEDVHKQKIKDYEKGGHKLLKFMEDVTWSTSKTLTRAQKYYSMITGPINAAKGTYYKSKQKDAKAQRKKEKREKVKSKLPHFRKG